jgi:hypothetical protein
MKSIICSLWEEMFLTRLAMALGLALLVAGTLCSGQDLQPPGEQVQQSEPQPAPTATLTTVHGVVRNGATGAPLPRALVRIEGSEIAQLTDGEGRFELAGVSVGPQIIRLRKPGFLDRPYATEDAGYQNDGPAHSVLVVDGMAGLNFTLTPTSAIHGRIELSTGDPAQGIVIILLKQIIRNGRAVWAQNGITNTNGSGAYRFASLPAGVYALYTQPSMENEPAAVAVAKIAKIAQNGYPSVFYPEAREFSGAARIRLKAGDQAEANMRLTLEPFYAVKATVVLPNVGEYFESIFESGSEAAFVLDAAGRHLPYTAKYDQTTHTIQTSLPDGTYTIHIGGTSDRQGTRGQQNVAGREKWNAVYLEGFGEFSVEGHAVSNLHIPLARLPDSPVHLRAARTLAQSNQTGINGSQKLQDLVTVTATPASDAPLDGPDMDSVSEDSVPDQLELLFAGFGPHQWISTQVKDRNLCVDSFSAGGINLAREPLNVALGASPPPMELTLRDDCAKLALTLPPALADFLPGEEPFYTVYVVPDFDTTADIPPMTMHPSSGATLTVDGLAPGSYHVYVFNEPVRLEYRNPAAMAALPTPGQQVTLSAGTTGNLMLEVPGR